jgi:malonate transporter MadM subunit
MIAETITSTLTAQGLLTAFAIIGGVMLLAEFISARLTGGRIHASAIAVLAGLALAWLGGAFTGASKGLADIPMLAGIGLLGGSMLRDFAIVATAFEVDVAKVRAAGVAGVAALLLGLVVPFTVAVLVARAAGYTDPATLTTIGAGAITYIVGPVTGSALGASPDIMAISIAIGLLKSILVMVATPLLAKPIRLTDSRSAMVFGGMMATTSGVSAGLAATDRALVPYGALTATFSTGLGCLLAPSLFFLMVRAA